jgi:hypothetical protein
MDLTVTFVPRARNTRRITPRRALLDRREIRAAVCCSPVASTRVLYNMAVLAGKLGFESPLILGLIADHVSQPNPPRLICHANLLPTDVSRDVAFLWPGSSGKNVSFSLLISFMTSRRIQTGKLPPCLFGARYTSPFLDYLHHGAHSGLTRTMRHPLTVIEPQWKTRPPASGRKTMSKGNGMLSKSCGQTLGRVPRNWQRSDYGKQPLIWHQVDTKAVRCCFAAPLQPL